MAGYSFKDFVVAINTNDVEQISEIAKRYPLPFAKIAKACAIAPDAMAEVAELVDDATTGVKMNGKAKAAWGAEGDSKPTSAEPEPDTQDDEEKAEEAPRKRRGRPRKAAAEQPAEEAEKPTPKRRGRPKKVAEPDPEPEQEEEESENPYEGMKAPELYKECKQRGIEVKPRQKAQVYIDLLIENDNAPDEVDSDDEDDWDI